MYLVIAVLISPLVIPVHCELNRITTPKLFSENFWSSRNKFRVPARFSKTNQYPYSGADAYIYLSAQQKKIQSPYITPCVGKCSLTASTDFKKYKEDSENRGLYYQFRDSFEPVTASPGVNPTEETSTERQHSLHRSSTSQYIAGVKCALTDSNKCARKVVGPAKAAIFLFPEDRKRRNKISSLQHNVPIRSPFKSVGNIAGVSCPSDDSNKCMRPVVISKAEEYFLRAESDIEESEKSDKREPQIIVANNFLYNFPERKINKVQCSNLNDLILIQKCIRLFKSDANIIREKSKNNGFWTGIITQYRNRKSDSKTPKVSLSNAKDNTSLYAVHRQFQMGTSKDVGKIRTKYKLNDSQNDRVSLSQGNVASKDRNYAPVGVNTLSKACSKDHSGGCKSQVVSSSSTPVHFRPGKITYFKETGLRSFTGSNRPYRTVNQDQCIDPETGERILDHMCDNPNENNKSNLNKPASQSSSDSEEMEHKVENDEPFTDTSSKSTKGTYRHRKALFNFPKKYFQQGGRKLSFHDNSKPNILNDTKDQSMKYTEVLSQNLFAKRNVHQQNEETTSEIDNTRLVGTMSQPLFQQSEQFAPYHRDNNRLFRSANPFRRIPQKYSKKEHNLISSDKEMDKQRRTDAVRGNEYGQALEAKTSAYATRIFQQPRHASYDKVNFARENTLGKSMKSSKTEESSLLNQRNSRQQCWKFLGRVTSARKVDIDTPQPCDSDFLLFRKKSDKSDIPIVLEIQSAISSKMSEKLDHPRFKRYSRVTDDFSNEVDVRYVQNDPSGEFVRTRGVSSDVSPNRGEEDGSTNLKAATRRTEKFVSGRIGYPNGDSVFNNACSQNTKTCATSNNQKSSNANSKYREMGLPRKALTYPLNIPEFLIERQNAQARRLANHMRLNSDSESEDGFMKPKQNPAFVGSRYIRSLEAQPKLESNRNTNLSCSGKYASESNRRGEQCNGNDMSRMYSEGYRVTDSDSVLQRFRTMYPNKFKKTLTPIQKLFIRPSKLEDEVPVSDVYNTDAVRYNKIPVVTSVSNGKLQVTNNEDNGNKNNFRKVDSYSDLLGAENDESDYKPPPVYIPPIRTDSTDLLIDDEDEEARDMNDSFLNSAISS